MREVIFILIPIIIISIIIKIFQSIFNANRCDKIISNLVLGIIQLIGVIYLISFFNNLGFNLFLFLTIIIIIITNAIHFALETHILDISLTKTKSTIIILLLQNLIIGGTFMYIYL